jgi:hypothetical protein
MVDIYAALEKSFTGMALFRTSMMLGCPSAFYIWKEDIIIIIWRLWREQAVQKR